MPASAPRIVFIGLDPDDPAWRAMCGGARRFVGGMTGVSLECVAPQRGGSAEQAALARATADSAPDALCLLTDSPSAVRGYQPGDAQDELADAALAIRRRGILLVTIGRALPDGSAFAHLAVDYAAAAEVLGRALTEIAPGRASYVLLHEDGRTAESSRCYERFVAVAPREHPPMKRLLARPAPKPAWSGAQADGAPRGAPPGVPASGPGAGFGREASAAALDASHAAVVREMLALFRDAGLVVTLSPRCWLEDDDGAEPPFETPFATLSAVPALWGDLRAGRALALVGPLDGDVGYRAVELAWLGLIGGVHAGHAESIPCELVTRATLDDFARRYAAAAGMSPAALLPGE